MRAKPNVEDTIIARETLDDSREDEPARRGVDMRLQRDEVFARLFGSPGEQRIGRYLVHGTLGQGGMGKVLRAHDETLGRDVALKVLHDGRGGKQGQRLLREAQALAQLAHPNVVRVYDVSEVDGRLCMAMELVRGTSLDRWQRRPRSWTEVLQVYLQAGRGLVAAHAQGLVHRDFKPANCILDEQGLVKVLDFGLARGVGTEPESTVAPVDVERAQEAEVTAEESLRASRSQRMLNLSLTRTGTMLGTLAYMAPEQLMGKAAEPNSDQFAFCVSLHEALYGTRPFAGSTPMSILYAIQSQVLVAPAGRPSLPPVPKWLYEVLRRGLSVAIHQRYPSMEALLAALERGLARRRRVRTVAASATVMAGLGVVLYASGVFQGEQPCEGLRDASMPAWSAEQRHMVGTAIERSGLPDAARTRERVEEHLDAYASAWVEARVDACEATWVRHEAGEQALARRMACLADRLTYVQATVEELSLADARVAAHAVGALEEIPSLEPCADAEALLRGPAPVPSEHAEQAAKIHELIARSWAIGATGHDERGMDAAEHAVEAAEAIPEAPGLRLEARFNRGHLLREMRQWARARQDLESALELAEALGDSMRAIETLNELVRAAVADDDASAASAWLAAIRGKLARLDHQPRMAARHRLQEAMVALVNERLDDALEMAEQAVRMHETLEQRGDTAHAEALMTLGEIYIQRNELDRAHETFEQVRRMSDESGNLPQLAISLQDLAYLEYAGGRFPEARTLVETALATYATFDRAGDKAMLRPRLLLAQIHRMEGKLDAAVEQALLVQRDVDEHVSPQIRGEAANLLGALYQTREDPARALVHYREAREAYEGVRAPNRVDLAMIDSNMADCLAASGEHALALTLYDQSLAVLTVDTAPDDPRRAYPLFGRGKVRLELGERAAGIADLRKVLALTSALEQDPSLGAGLRWTLGQALRVEGAAPSEEDSREAGRLVRQARDAYAGAGFTEFVADLDAWLDACGRPCAPLPEQTIVDHPKKNEDP
ncbi:protein kinase domain-containing protein [Paraliomyxa miuraensis]|uniref:serine/threonine-protein kinase n=1 Tax=Paraliomyxa miuraensis TaxID=376150 RepID=UPI0022538B6E|nr:serine/threonine-protein kinase [Paraliomyxa miuraensis]